MPPEGRCFCVTRGGIPVSTTHESVPYDPQRGDIQHDHILNVAPRLDARDKIDPLEANMGAAAKPITLAMIADQFRPPRLDQLPLGACTANGTAYQYMIHRLVAGLEPTLVSRLQLYYDERKIEGDIPEDAGADPRDGLKVFNKQGVGAESFWPYDISKFAHQPPAAVYADAPHQKIGAYYRLSSLSTIKHYLAQPKSDPIGLAMLVFDGMERSKNGVIPMPGAQEQPLGGHWLTITGAEDRPDWPGGGYVRLDNSWGMQAGNGKGEYFLPYQYLLNSALCPVKWRFVLPKAA
jgi:hypothetical protein